jgi:hypothetical protein
MGGSTALDAPRAWENARTKTPKNDIRQDVVFMVRA